MKKYLKLPLYIFINFLKIDWVEHLNIFSNFNIIIQISQTKKYSLSLWLNAKIVVKNSSSENILQILTFLLLQLSLFLSFLSVFSFFSSNVSFSFIFNTNIQNKNSVHWIFWKIQYSLRKPIDSHWLKNVLLALFSLQLCLFFFHKMMKFYKKICSAWISRASAESIFSQIDAIVVVKIQWKYLQSIEMYLYGFFQTEYG